MVGEGKLVGGYSTRGRVPAGGPVWLGPVGRVAQAVVARRAGGCRECEAGAGTA